ncbi:MAG: hypothetical protein HZC41_22000 [Chloroflexi bacterium]|nr:hypothetical protein [Chloroflexota bacterium]
MVSLRSLPLVASLARLCPTGGLLAAAPGLSAPQARCGGECPPNPPKAERPPL